MSAVPAVHPLQTTNSTIQSKFVQSGSYRSYQQYKWEVAPGQYLYLDGSDMKISAEASMFIFDKPPEGLVCRYIHMHIMVP